ncbi:MAG: hypothetical protein IIA82_03770 [Thaumarchaeota archaeon]|nr:hypothetical protein [Nitrososphaerota archaeon]
MDPQDLQEKIKIAKESVQDQEEPYKTEAFKIILSSLIGGTKFEKPKDGSSPKRKRKSTPKGGSTQSSIVYEMKNKPSEFAKKCNISEDELFETISIKKDIIQIVKKLKLKETEKHIQFGLCILTSYKILYEIEWLPTTRFRKCLDDSGVGDLGHIFRSLSSTSLIINRGTKTGKEYKVTGKGIDTACEYICKLAKGEFKT